MRMRVLSRLRRLSPAVWAGVAIACAMMSSVVVRALPSGTDLSEPPVRKVEPHWLDNFDDASIALFRKSKAAEAKGDFRAALQFMQQAANYMHAKNSWNFELWDNLASLHCKQASREKDKRYSERLRAAGRAMLGEFRCAADVWRGKRECWLASLSYEHYPDKPALDSLFAMGSIPNPAVTPLCFRTLCGTGFGATMQQREDEQWGASMDAEPPDGMLDWPLEDAKDLPQIEKLCRAPRAQR
jgi:hypothetical protein